MDVRLRERWDELRASYWFVPTLMIFGAVLLWAVLGIADRALRPMPPLAWLYYDTIASARTLMFAIAGAMIGVIGVVFSITTVPLTIAASQFGPRLLRTFLRDTGTQIVLGTFTATFIFCMLVLLRLRDETTSTLPQLSLTVGLVLAFASLGMLIYYINHVAVSMQAPNVVAAVSAELQAAIDRMFPPAEGAAALPPAGATPPDPAGARVIVARDSGYVQARDDNALVKLAAAHDLIVQLFYEPGAFVTAGTRLACVWPVHAPAEIDAAVNDVFVLDWQRTLVQDVEFGINELAEVALRALSPAINDPFTAMTCIDWLGRALCQLCMRVLPSPYQYDSAGALRLITVPFTFGRAVDSAFNQIREYGRGSTSVTLHLLNTLAVVGECARTADQRAHLLRHASMIERGIHDGIAEAAGRETIAERFRTVAALLQLP